ncbi:hypothetical protein KGQ20_39830 [Catenulispora sp. NF23]|uniref:hypothetical protein n=1 Tax=Catenulispora pinistramenti TaxID=2705254 RepID=UPI001BACCA84|nr:hypothetical protein [Catenulispora pinistramenti]MBS2538915.1 hypothetical protein [Catenulispora pinistramenti]
MADSTANSTPDGFEDAVAAMRQMIAHEGDAGRLYKISVTREDSKSWKVEAHSWGGATEIECIYALQNWAQALGGELELSQSQTADYGTCQRHWRSLTVKATVGGAAVEIWDHVDVSTTTTATEQASELVAAHG